MAYGLFCKPLTATIFYPFLFFPHSGKRKMEAALVHFFIRGGKSFLLSNAVKKSPTTVPIPQNVERGWEALLCWQHHPSFASCLRNSV